MLSSGYGNFPQTTQREKKGFVIEKRRKIQTRKDNHRNKRAQEKRNTKISQFDTLTLFLFSFVIHVEHDLSIEVLDFVVVVDFDFAFHFPSSRNQPTFQQVTCWDQLQP